MELRRNRKKDGPENTGQNTPHPRGNPGLEPPVDLCSSKADKEVLLVRGRRVGTPLTRSPGLATDGGEAVFRPDAFPCEPCNVRQLC